MPHTNDKAGCLSPDLVIFPVVLKWYPPSLSSLEPCTPTNGSVIDREIENTWRLASSNGASVLFIRGIKHWQMNVCCHRAAAVFVIGICRITQRGWRNRMTGHCIRFIFQWALCNYRCFSGMHLLQSTHFSENILTCKCPLSPNCASDHNIKRNEVSETRRGRSIK